MSRIFVPGKLPFFLLFIFIVLGVYAGAAADNYLNAVSVNQNFSVHSIETFDYERDIDGSASDGKRPSQGPPSRAELVMKAFASAYPERMGPAQFRGGDWAVFLGGQWYYYAEGRLLPETHRNRVAEYSVLPFYNYAAELPPWTAPTLEESERMRGMMERRQEQSRSTVQRSTHFFDALWRTHNRDESWDRVKSMKFLGHTVMMHYSILTQLSLVEEMILAEAKTNTEVKRWIDSIGTVEGWSWRNISQSQSRSYHSYGAAIDLLPRSLGGLATYWLWSAQNNQEWWAIPYNRRYHPPKEVIKAFESMGFVWGGKWTVYDTMHFEYRPEILVLSGLPLTDHQSFFSAR